MNFRSLTIAAAAVVLSSVACSSPNNNGTGGGGSTAAGTSSGGSASGGTAGAGGGSTGGMSGGGDTTAGMSGGGSGGASGGDGGSGGTGGAAPAWTTNFAPKLLSETGLFTDIVAKKLNPDVHEFTPKYALWSDTAQKQRYVYMPPGGKITTDGTQNGMEFWEYPVGFRLWKDFTRDGKLIETRLLLKKGGLTDWYMVAFKWRDDYSDADALEMGEMNAMGTQHDIPPTEACKGCHGTMWDNAIGFSALELSNNPGNFHIEDLIQLGWFNTPPAGPFTLPGSEADQAALGYLHANCGMCHNQNSSVYNTKTSLDLWTHLDKLGSLEESPAYLSMVCKDWPGDKFSPITSCPVGDATGAPMDTDISFPQRVVPGSSATSGVHDMMSLRASGDMSKQMPPLGTEMVDDMGLATVDAWINGLQAK